MILKFQDPPPLPFSKLTPHQTKYVKTPHLAPRADSTMFCCHTVQITFVRS